MDLSTVSTYIKRLLEEQEMDPSNLTIDTIRNQVVALNKVVSQFVKAANRDEKIRDQLGVSDDEIRKVHLFEDLIQAMNDNDIGFYSKLYECKLINKIRLNEMISEVENLRALSISMRAQEQDVAIRQIEILKRLANEVNY